MVELRSRRRSLVFAATSVLFLGSSLTTTTTATRNGAFVFPTLSVRIQRPNDTSTSTSTSKSSPSTSSPSWPHILNERPKNNPFDFSPHNGKSSKLRITERELIQKLGLKIDGNNNYMFDDVMEQLIIRTAAVEELKDALKQKNDFIKSLETTQAELASRLSAIDKSTKELKKERNVELKQLERSEQELKEAIAKLSKFEEMMEASKKLDQERKQQLDQSQKALLNALSRIEELEKQLDDGEAASAQSSGEQQKIERKSIENTSSIADPMSWFASPSKSVSKSAPKKAKSPSISSKVATKKQEKTLSFNFGLAEQSMKFPEIREWELKPSGELTGKVYNHPDINNGVVIVTSELAKPSLASEQAVVETKSGSKYKLGIPAKRPNRSSTPSRSRSVAAPSQQPQSDIQLALSGETVYHGKYLLTGKGMKSVNGRCFIWTGYRGNGKSQPVGDALAIKVSSNEEAIHREYSNYQKFASGIRRNAIIDCYDLLQVTDKNSRFTNRYALVMEKGKEDLKDFLLHRSFDTKTLKDVLWSAVQCLRSMHSAKMVWTDMKPENFVVVETGNKIQFKAIDLESAVPVKENPRDYTPEACPPEFAKAFYAGEAYDYELEYSYDIWSFGMMAYELYTGEGFYSNSNPEQIMKRLERLDVPTNVHQKIHDNKLADLISQSLSVDPKQRPTVQKLLKHPYFRGIGAQTTSIFGW